MMPSAHHVYKKATRHPVVARSHV
ncbi:hypothetical protein F383_27765 [Gossypium arboreum]|uniref:Uncharacterized protein n=1 Tax=Gossypium arboreum TaxID=29729 RepID=A0A0B0PC73_GOSAR|nr:hypothetical protein F383_27765 [Gossypium arboreum]